MTAASSAGAALVRVAWTPGRAEPSHRSELVTQWLCGERLILEEEGDDGWLRVTGPDGYGSWVDGGGVRRTDPEEGELWEREADRISLGTELRPASDAGGEDGTAPGEGTGAGLPRFLPWGARVATWDPGGDDGGDELRIRLPDGRAARPADPERLVAREECVLRFPPRGDALMATAASWTGVPYLWGGRTREGVDCSGYVQAVLALHRIELPRDSGRQMETDEAVWRAPREGASGGAPRPGDVLALAREVLRPGDLLFFGTEAEAITHVALWAQDTEVLHAAARRGQVARDDLAADDPLMGRLRGRLVAVTRPLGRDRDADD